MNRNEEYWNYVSELEEDIPSLEHSLDKARKRHARKQIIFRPLTGFSVIFALFVLLVNYSTPVAYACSQIPLLRELAEAVTFSRSLSDAVENEFVQAMDLNQTNGDVTATIEYLIADKKKVYIFFRLDSDRYSEMETDGYVQFREKIPVGDRNLQEVSGAIRFDWHNFDELDNGLRMLAVDFGDQDVPQKIELQLQVCEGSESEYEFFWQREEAFREYVAEFHFELEFDPSLIAVGKVIEVNRALELDGQRFTITDIEMYPTYMCVNLTEAADNTAWLNGLRFYVETDNGIRFERNGNMSGSANSESMLEYELESPYFYEMESMNLVFTAAGLVDKEKTMAYVNLASGEAAALPEGKELVSVEKQNGEWLLLFRSDYSEDADSNVRFDFTGYDADGTEYTLQGQGENGESNADGKVTYVWYTLRLRDYPYEEIWLSFERSHRWTAEAPIMIPVQLDSLKNVP